MKIQNLYYKIWEKDPGLLRFKLSLKTVIAVLIAVAVTLKFDTMTIACAGLAAGFGMQGIHGYSRKMQFGSCLMMYAGILFGYSFGALSAPYPLISTGLLAVIGFFAFYARRFGPRYAFPPLFMWILTFLGIILPHNNIASIFHSLIGVGIGCIISCLVYFLIFPIQHEKAFLKNLKKFFMTCHNTLHWLAKSYQVSIDPKVFHAIYQANMQRLRAELLLNQSLIDYVSESTKGAFQKQADLLIHQFLIGKSVAILMESTWQVTQNPVDLANKTGTQLVKMLNYYADIFLNININSKTLKITIMAEASQSNEYLDELKQILEQYNLTENCQNLLYLFNLNLGFKRLWKNLSTF